jgi:hypothetical protein
MKITLRQYGGLAAAVRKPELVLDTAALGEQRGQVEALARALSARPGSSASPHPDEPGYALTIAGDDGTHEVSSMDTGASEDFAALVQHVRRCGKAGAADR